MRQIYDVVIIGAGVAGMTAAVYLARAGKKVLIIEEKVCGGQIMESDRVENWPGKVRISGAELSQGIYHQVNNLGVEIRYEKVLKVQRSEEYLSVDDAMVGGRRIWMVSTDGDNYACGAIIIAVGTAPRRLDAGQMRAVKGRPVSYCATCDGALYRGKPVVVVGSGNTAKYEVEYLSGIASRVYQVHHDDPLPEDAEAIFVAIGRVPATEFISDVVDLDDAGYIIAGEDCVTSVPGIYAAGDCRTKGVRQLVTAAGDGAVASASAVNFLSRKKV